MDDQGFEELMERAREVSRAGSSRRAREPRRGRTSTSTRRGAALRKQRRLRDPLRRLRDDRGGDRVAARRSATTAGCSPSSRRAPSTRRAAARCRTRASSRRPRAAREVVDVFRLGDDQALALEPVEGEIGPGEAAKAIGRAATRGSPRCATTPPRTCCTPRCAQRLGTHVRQAGSYVGPGQAALRLHPRRAPQPSEELADVEGAVSDWIAENHPVRAVETTRDEAEALGAMALFGEKYGDWVRMVEIEGVSRELCGGTHVATTAEVGLFHLTHETSSASNVRRIEAVTGPAGARAVPGAHRGSCASSPSCCACPSTRWCGAVERLNERVEGAPEAAAGRARPRSGRRARGRAPRRSAGVRVVVEAVDAPDPKALLALSDAVRQKLGDAAVVLGCAVDGRVHLVANFAPAVVERGLKAGDVVRAAAAGRGRRRRRARHDGAGRRPRPGEAARGARRLRGSRSRRRSRIALMAGSSRWTTGRPAAAARCPTPPGRWRRRCQRSSGRTPGEALPPLARLVEEHGAERVVVGLPLTLRGEEGEQAGRARAFAERLARRVSRAGGAARRAPDDPAGRAHRAGSRRRLARRRPPARELSGGGRAG